MSPETQKAILAIALQAAFADGVKDDGEREEVRRIAESLAKESKAIDLRSLYQDVLLRRYGIAEAVADLSDDGTRHYAYEMALCVCEADGQLSAAEKSFLDELKRCLGMTDGEARQMELEVAPFAAAVDKLPPAASVPGEAELDKTILNYALLAGALELLPQSWASMAIIPLQIKLVYEVGNQHGITLDQGHVKEFIAAAGVGLTSQYLEQFGRKLLGGLLGKAAGKTFGKIGGAATGMAFSFATTYALGQVAKLYYAGGRTMNTALLRDTFQNLLGPAKQLQTQYLPQIEQKAATLDAAQVMALMRA